jgi:hypothetical protein
VAKRGRPTGSVIRLLDDPARFEIAMWHALTAAGMKPYPAAYLATFLLASDRPITTEIIDGVLLKTSADFRRTTVAGHAGRLRRNAPKAIDRADDHGRGWLAQSSGLLFGLLKFAADKNADGFAFTLDRLRDARAGWSEPLHGIFTRIDEATRSNFAPASGPLSRTAARLLRDMRQTDA